MSSLLERLEIAERQRTALVSTLQEEGTDCYRLFHGVSDGRPGLTVDRYGPVYLASLSERLPLDEVESQHLQSFLADRPCLTARRSGPRLELVSESSTGLWESRFHCRELGMEFAIELARANRDPQLFLDFRAAKRAVRSVIAAAVGPVSVLNLFAYTCSVGCHAASAGAREVFNVDFSGGNLAWGQRNFRRNGLSLETEFLELDCVAALWAWSGNQKALSRHRASSRPALSPRQFSVVVVDPPAFSKGKFATVDLVNDPETVYGPAWQVVAPGGVLVAANNSAKMKREVFEARLRRMFAKRSGHSEVEIDWVSPDSDFPSFDSEPPLKVAFCRKPTTFPA